MWMWDLLVDVCVWCLLFVVGAAVLVLIMMMWFGWNGNTFYVEERERERRSRMWNDFVCMRLGGWCGGSERVLSFSALFTLEMKLDMDMSMEGIAFCLCFGIFIITNIIIFVVYIHKYIFSYWNKIPVFILWKGDGSKRYTNRYPVKLLQRAEFYDLGGLNLHALLSAFSPSLFGFHNNNGQEREGGR